MVRLCIFKVLIVTIFKELVCHILFIVWLALSITTEKEFQTHLVHVVIFRKSTILSATIVHQAMMPKITIKNTAVRS